jgi:hypothetical protein
MLQWIKCLFGYHTYEKGYHTLELGFHIQLTPEDDPNPPFCQRCVFCKKRKQIYVSTG